MEADVAALLDRCRAADPDLVVTAHTPLTRDPFQTPTEAAVIAAVSDAAQRVTGAPAETVLLSCWADSAFIAAAALGVVLCT